MIVTDRTRIETGWDCMRKRYWGYQYGGWGLESSGPIPLDLAYGLAFHEGAEVIGNGGDLPAALLSAEKWTSRIEGVTIDGLPKKEEYYALAYGHLRTFQEQVLPELLEHYRVRGIETEIALELGDNVLDLTRLDIALQDKQTGYNYYVEYKTDSNPSDIGSRMQFNLQFVLGVAALAKALNEPVVGSIVVGVDKGAKRGPSPTEVKHGQTGERREGPFTYAYCLDTGFKTEWSLEWKKNWKKVPIWQYMTLPDWFEKLSSFAPTAARERFVISEPIMWDPDGFARMSQQLIHSEKTISEGTALAQGMSNAESVLEKYFPMNRKNCKNDGGYRKACPFTDLCHFGRGDAPLDWGFKYRSANHPLEETIRKKPDAL